MTSTATLPRPWEEVGLIEPESRRQLEDSIGSKVHLEDLEEGVDLSTNSSGVSFPMSEKARWFAGHRWVEIRNNDTQESVYLRLQRLQDSQITITSVALPFNGGRPVTGSALRDLPVAAIAAAYTAEELKSGINLRRAAALGFQVIDPLTPLPEKVDRSDFFLALVAQQYDALELQGSESPTRSMANLNKRPYPTVGRWVSQARKAGLLLPAQVKK